MVFNSLSRRDFLQILAMGTASARMIVHDGCVRTDKESTFNAP